MSQKDQQLKKNTFLYLKVKVSKLTRIENFQMLGFFETNGSVGAKPQKRCANIIVNSESIKPYRDLGT